MVNLIDRMNDVSKKMDDIQKSIDPKDVKKMTAEKESSKIKNDFISSVISMLNSEIPILENTDMMRSLLQKLDVERLLFEQNIKKKTYISAISSTK